MPDYSLDIAVAQAVEPMPLPPQIRDLNYVLWSPLLMWIWNDTASAWQAGTFQDSMNQAMRAYELYFLRTGWRLVGLQHFAQEEWQATFFKSGGTIYLRGSGTTAAIAICEAIKAASLADTERATLETEVRGSGESAL